MRALNVLWTLIPLAMIATACSGVKGLVNCSKDEDCLSGGGGIEYACDLANTKVCLRTCTTSTATSDCLKSQYCDTPAGDTEGLCREGRSQAGDPGGDAGGDADAGD